MRTINTWKEESGIFNWDCSLSRKMLLSYTTKTYVEVIKHLCQLWFQHKVQNYVNQMEKDINEFHMLDITLSLSFYNLNILICRRWLLGSHRSMWNFLQVHMYKPPIIPRICTSIYTFIGLHTYYACAMQLHELEIWARYWPVLKPGTLQRNSSSLCFH